MIGRYVLALLLVALLAGAGASQARADGDPGSDVLVNQNLFLAADAGVSPRQQVQLGELLDAADRSGFPIRVAIIATRADLGTVGPLWLKPAEYARYLGIELSLIYRQRLLVVMPNGFGLSWPRHATAAGAHALARIRPASTRPTGTGLVAATERAIRALARAAHVKIGSPAGAPATAAPVTHASARASPVRHGRPTSSAGTAVALALLCVLAAGALIVWLTRQGLLSRLTRQGPLARAATAARRLAFPRAVRGVPGVALLLGLGLALGALGLILDGASPPASRAALERNPNLDPGTPSSRPARNFTLTDQFGRSVSLHQFRGKVVLLAFIDSECTTLCPLTTTAMRDAKAMLGAAGSRVQLLGVDANPKATAIEDVLAYSQLHGLLHEWHFLTGSAAQLKRVWARYGIFSQVQAGLISHTPALFVIGPGGRERMVYMTQQSYAAVGQLGQLLAHEASALLPGHPPVHSHLSYAGIPGISPATATSLPTDAGGSVHLGPGSPRLLLFFATWDQEMSPLAGELDRLNRYQASARRGHLPVLTAVDEGSVEPSPRALPSFIRRLAQPLHYPVAIDRSGRVADGYEVQGQPWFVLTSASGRIIWYRQVDTTNWPSTAALMRAVRAALARPSEPTTARAAERELADSPRPLAALHARASELLGSASALQARLRSLRGYPIVLNAWASWCAACQQEFGLLATAAAHYGREVAFLGADTGDSAGDARSFLASHPVSYPSYQVSETGLSTLVRGGLYGLPTTIFINRAGRVVHVQTGEYDSLGTLDTDIDTYALAGG